jgi:1,2-diacylglycerol 3-alpha-glucosyltransferase
MKVLFLLENIGNYHKARLISLGYLCDLVAVQVYRKSSIYSWQTNPFNFNFKNYSLLTELDTEVYKQNRFAVKKLKKIFEIENPDCIAIPGWGVFYSISAMRWAKKNNKLIIILSDSQEIDSKRMWLKEAIKTLFVKYCDGALVAGYSHSLYIQKLGVQLFRIKNSYDVVDNKFFEKNRLNVLKNAEQYRAQYDLPLNYFLVVSRLIEKKNIELLIYAFSKYKKATNLRSLDLVIVGNGLQLKYLESLTKKLGVSDYIHFYGFKDYSEICVFYSLAEVFILPSKEDQWGLVVNEAMACSLPVLVSDKCGCSHDLVHVGINGYIFKSENCDDLLKYLILLSDFNANLKAMGLNSLKIIQNWSLETFAKNFIDLTLIKPNKRRLNVLHDLFFAFLERLLSFKVEK